MSNVQPFEHSSTDDSIHEFTDYEVPSSSSFSGDSEEEAPFDVRKPSTENDFEEKEDSNSQLIDELSKEPLGTWNRLVSRTNWEKGEVILKWRNQLLEAGLPNSTYSDESWAKRVGNVSSQHVGRLRRVFERFGSSREQFSGLYWSHFQAALDWEDAEMWLEGANLNQWSVAIMRIKRWETLGAPEDMKPREQDIVIAELDEDVNPFNDSRNVLEAGSGRIESAEKSLSGEMNDPNGTGNPGENEKSGKKKKKSNSAILEDEQAGSTGEALAKLNEIRELPEDLGEAFEQLKVAILNHKLAGWKDVDQQRILSFLSAMRAVVLAKDEE